MSACLFPETPAVASEPAPRDASEGENRGEVRSKPRSIAQLTATVSPSRISCWQQCRLKFYFRYVAGLQKPASPALHTGTAVHTVLQQWNLARWRKAPLDGDALREVFLQAWAVWQDGAPIRWEGEEEAQKASAWATLEAYFQETPIPADERPEGVEVGVEADLCRHGLPMLVGVLDLVRSGGRIVDFKTTRSSNQPETAGSAGLEHGGQPFRGRGIHQQEHFSPTTPGLGCCGDPRCGCVAPYRPTTSRAVEKLRYRGCRSWGAAGYARLLDPAACRGLHQSHRTFRLLVTGPASLPRTHGRRSVAASSRRADDRLRMGSPLS